MFLISEPEIYPPRGCASCFWNAVVLFVCHHCVLTEGINSCETITQRLVHLWMQRDDLTLLYPAPDETALLWSLNGCTEFILTLFKQRRQLQMFTHCQFTLDRNYLFIEIFKKKNTKTVVPYQKNWNYTHHKIKSYTHNIVYAVIQKARIIIEMGNTEII